ncbi:MAG: aquaporin [Thermoplasmata archaeon]|nr:aquaporin [Thermoplasmata archaeon]
MSPPSGDELVPPSRRLRAAAEVGGTALLVAIGTGAIVAGSNHGNTPVWVLPVAWFLAVTIPILLVAGTSGAHLNPLVTVVLWGARTFPRIEIPVYVVAQLAGAVLGSTAVALVLGSGARLGSTVPSGGAWMLALLGESVFTLLLLFSVLYLAAAGPGTLRWRLVLPGAVVGVSTFVIGPISGSSLNLARSLAPAILSGTYTDLWVYFLAQGIAAAAAIAVARLRRPP